MDNAPAQPQPEAVATVTVEPASFWVRGGASVLDSMLLAVVALAGVPGLPILVALGYKTYFVSQGGQTPGKLAAGIRVIRADGEKVSAGRALGRAAGEYLSSIVLGLGYLIAAFGEKRALHDYVAGTRVINLDGIPKWRRVVMALLGIAGPLVIVGGLALVAIPSFGKFKALAQKSAEGATKGNLGSLRAGASIFYGDTEGTYPKTLDELVPKYIAEIHAADTQAHGKVKEVTVYGADVCAGTMEVDPAKLKDTGGWGYVNDPKASCYGTVFVDCSHKTTDSKGQEKVWAAY
jgi:uncharacterized RDD family membrane protein YckC